jgi:beta-glucosidase
MYSGSTYLYFEGDALYPFGHGLSYSEFEYSDFTVRDCGDDIEATVKIKNVSAVYGEEVVQLYFTALEPRVKRPKIQLCEFIRQGIEPGKTVEITFAFEKSRLRFWDVTRNKFAVESGEYRFSVGSSSKDIRGAVEIPVKGEKIPPRNMEKASAAIDCDGRWAVELRYDPNRGKHYVYAPEFGGGIEFYNADLSNITEIQVSAAMAVNSGKISVFVKDKFEGEIEIPACACPTDFKKRKCSFKKPLRGKGKLTLKISQNVNLLDVKLL